MGYSYDNNFAKTVRLLDTVTLYTFLTPYLSTQQAFNQHHFLISKVLTDFLSELHTPEVSTMILSLRYANTPNMSAPDLTRKEDLSALLAIMRKQAQKIGNLNPQEKKLYDWAHIHLKHTPLLFNICADERSYKALLHILGLPDLSHCSVESLRIDLASCMATKKEKGYTSTPQVLTQLWKELPLWLTHRYGTLNLATGYPANTSEHTLHETKIDKYTSNALVLPTAICFGTIVPLIPTLFYNFYPSLYVDMGLVATKHSLNFGEIYGLTLALSLALLVTALIVSAVLTAIIDVQYKNRETKTLVPHMRTAIEEYTQAQVKTLNEKCNLLARTYEQIRTQQQTQLQMASAPPPCSSLSTIQYQDPPTGSDYPDPNILTTPNALVRTYHAPYFTQ